MATKTAKKIKTGFCANKQCEGTKPKSPSGVPMKVCVFWQTCACDCHRKITELYEMAGMDRLEPEQSPEYVEAAEKRHLETAAMLESLDRIVPVSGALSIASDTDTHPSDEGSPTVPPRAATGPSRPILTPTGRRAKGSLEHDVLAVCVEYMQGVYEWEHCTPKLISERIAKLYAVEPPSTGAINAVWDRWEKLGFAEQAKKPSRFVKFTVDSPSPVVLEKLKAEVKRNKKRSQAEMKRGTLRPRGR